MPITPFKDALVGHTTWMEILYFSMVHKTKNYGIFYLVFQVEKLILSAHQKGVFLQEIVTKPIRFPNLQ